MPPTFRFAVSLAFTPVLLWPSMAAAQFRYPPVPYYGYRFAPPESDLRIEATPKEARVYVDGYFAGVVDDFDGVFQRLHVVPGEHEISLYLEGYRTHREKLYLSPRSSRTIEVALEQLAAGEPAEAPPSPIAPPAGAPPPGTRGLLPRRGPGRLPPGAPPASRVGALTIQVRPADAEILIDGERWAVAEAAGASGDDRLPVQLSEGRHRIEVRKDGYRPFVTEVVVRAGETVPLNVSLTPEGL